MENRDEKGIKWRGILTAQQPYTCSFIGVLFTLSCNILQKSFFPFFEQSKQKISQNSFWNSCLEKPIQKAVLPHLSSEMFYSMKLKILIYCYLDFIYLFQQFKCLSCSEGPKLNTVCEVQYHQCWVQGNNHFPGPAGHTISDTSQDATGFLGHSVTLLAHDHLAVKLATRYDKLDLIWLNHTYNITVQWTVHYQSWI